MTDICIAYLMRTYLMSVTMYSTPVQVKLACSSGNQLRICMTFRSVYLIGKLTSTSTHRQSPGFDVLPVTSTLHQHLCEPQFLRGLCKSNTFRALPTSLNTFTVPEVTTRHIDYTAHVSWLLRDRVPHQMLRSRLRCGCGIALSSDREISWIEESPPPDQEEPRWIQFLCICTL